MNKATVNTAVLAVAMVGISARGAILTFEKFSPGTEHFLVPAGYGGLEWANFEVLNAQNQGFRTGYRTGMVSPNNVIFNAYGDPATIRSATAFELQSAYLTAAVIDGLQVQVTGFAGEQQLYVKTVELNTSAPTLVNFSFEGVNRVEFVAMPGSQFAIDNLNVVVPGAGPSVDPVVTPPAEISPVNLGRIEVATIGEATLAVPRVVGPPVAPPGSGGGSSAKVFYLIDQSQFSGGGSVLPNVDVNWDTNMTFVVTIAPPVGKKFAVTLPAGAQAGFGGFLWWETGDRGGFSASGPISVDFEELEGSAPNFQESDSVLSSSHGFFGVMDLESSVVTNNIAFKSMTIHGTVSPQVTGLGTRTFVPHNNSSLLISGSGINVAIVSGDGSAQSATVAPPLGIAPGPDGKIVVTFRGILQSAASASGPFEDVAGNPQSSYVASASGGQFFRTRKN